MEYTKPLPTPTIDSTPFWDACRAHELRLQRCGRCGHTRFPPSRVCPECLAIEHEWIRTSGRGKVFSWVVYHQVYHPAFAADAPYNVSIIELDEGPRIYGNVRGCANEALFIGMPVEVDFQDVTDQQTLFFFKPASD